MFDDTVVERKVIGHVDVDSGQVMIIDPCYVLPDERKSMPEYTQEPSAVANEKATIVEGEETSVYLRASDKSAYANYDNYSGKGDCFGEWGGGVISLTLYGDGTYPVTAELNKDNRVVRLIVDFGFADEKDEEELF
jgi:hypothetical protein